MLMPFACETKYHPDCSFQKLGVVINLSSIQFASVTSGGLILMPFAC
jgi:hypothetical protein